MTNVREQLLTDLSLLATGLKKIDELESAYNNSIIKERAYVIRKMSRNRQFKILKFGLIGIISTYILSSIVDPELTTFLWFFIPYYIYIMIKFLLSIDDRYRKQKVDNSILSFRKHDNIAQEYYKIQLNNPKQIAKIKQELNNAGVFDRIPNRYAKYIPVFHMFQYVNDMRADSIKEAINLYEQEMHNKSIQEQNRMIIDTTKQNLIETQATKSYAKTAAGAAIGAAINSKKSVEFSKKAAYNSSESARNSKEASHYANVAANTAKNIKNRLKK
ncbi:hypothetical protein [Macrococcoides canis]|uniref:hypothetical protein n=1 Tax=Macrococcoides canis TaxID=1855823 RepID=UPI0010FBCA47|nr:hypothetical protein [Macrococcus canis]QCT74182.1 hypothetical protein EST43_02570 [Macrococcus canis]